jgi:hypothetical protein
LIFENVRTHTDKKLKYMRTKTLLLSGVVAALSSAAAMAQVYSLNAVGYINVTVPPNFSIIANQLNTTNNNISPLLDSQLGTGAYNGMILFKYSSVNGYTTLNVDSLNTPPWGNPAVAQTTTMNPGEAVFIYNPYGTNITLTFVGTVLQGTLTNSLNQNFNLVSSIVPQAGAVDTNLGLVPNVGDVVFVYDSVNGYTTFNQSSTDPSGWGGGVHPSLNVGEGFFYYTPVATGNNWVRTFNVN